MFLCRNVDAQEWVKLRNAHYVLNLPVPELKSVIMDIATTVNIHPTNLCIETEEDGKMYVGYEVILNVYVRKNLFELEQAIRRMPDRPADLRLSSADMKNYYGKPKRLTTDSYIPSRILRVQQSANSGLLAVVALEHRNIATALEWLKEKTKHCLIVVVCIISSSEPLGLMDIFQDIRIPHANHQGVFAPLLGVFTGKNQVSVL